MNFPMNVGCVDGRLKLAFGGSKAASDAGLPACREIEEHPSAGEKRLLPWKMGLASLRRSVKIAKKRHVNLCSGAQMENSGHNRWSQSVWKPCKT
jgi:hypothetical protein